MTAAVKDLELKQEIFRAFAYGTHVPAYLDGGLADLSVSDLARIGWQPKANDLIFSSDGIAQGVEAAAVVAQRKIEDQTEATGKAVSDALQRLMSFFR